MMNDKDRDLIAALAEGRLSGTIAEDALARIETDPELAAEYADQVAALAFLQSGQPPQMTATERSTLRMNLTEQLGLVPETTSMLTSAKRGARWWQPVFGLAAAAVVVTAIVILPGTLTGDSADTAPVEVAVSEFDAAGEEDLQTETTQSAAGMADAAESPAAESQNLDEDMDIAVYETESVELGDLLERARGADGRDALEGQLKGFAFRSIIALDRAEVDRCLNALADDIPEGVVETFVIGAEVLDEGTAEVLDQVTIVHVGFDFGDGIDDALSFEIGSCSLVEHAPQG